MSNFLSIYRNNANKKFQINQTLNAANDIARTLTKNQVDNDNVKTEEKQNKVNSKKIDT